MYLKSIRSMIEQDALLTHNQKMHTCSLLNLVIQNLDNPNVWPWKTNDHKLLLKYYPEIIRELPQYEIDTEIAYAVLSRF